MRRVLPFVWLLSACASAPEAPPDYYGQCVGQFGYSAGSPQASACAERLQAQDQARRMAAFGLLMQNPPLRYNNVPTPAPMPGIAPGRVTCQYIGDKLDCVTQR